MKFLTPLLTASLLLGACSFSKHPNASSEGEITKIVLKDKSSEPTLEQLFDNNPRNEQIAFLTRKSNSDLAKLKDKNGNGLLDLIAKNMDYELANILENKGYSPFIFNNDDSLPFLRAYQEKELIKFDQSVSQGVVDLSVINSKNYPKETCEKVFGQLMHMRTSPNSDDTVKTDEAHLESLILKTINSDECRSNLKSLDDNKKNSFLSVEFIYQYKNNFPDLILVSSLLQSFDLKDKSIEGVDPQIFLDRKKDCLSAFQLKSWQKFINISLVRGKHYRLRLHDCSDIAEYSVATYAGACMESETAKEIDDHNVRVNKEVDDQFFLNEEDLSCQK